MGFGAVTLGGTPRPVRSWVKRGLDALCAGVLLVAGLPLHGLALLALGSSPWRRVPVVGRRGRVFALRAYRELQGPARWVPLLRFYPALLHVAAGELSFVGIAPLGAADWPRVDAAYRLNPPDAPVGLVAEPAGAGCWLSNPVAMDAAAPAARDLEERVACNRRYLRAWSLSGDLRVLLAAVFGRKETEGGAA